MATDRKPDQLTEQKLVNGWAAATKIKVRLARPADMAAVSELAALAGVRLEDELIAATRRPSTTSNGGPSSTAFLTGPRARVLPVTSTEGGGDRGERGSRTPVV